MSRSAYFDNAATSYPKPDEVYSFADKIYRTMGGSIGRGNGAQARSASSLARDSKDVLKRLLRCEDKEVVYTSSATDAINRILLGLDLACKTVYVSPFEHNAVTRVLHYLRASKDVDVRVLPFDKTTLLLMEQEMLDAFDNKKPDLVITTHASNVCGAILPIERICSAAKLYDAITLIDMSQTAGLIPLQLSMDTIDFAVFAGHKTLMAPFGIGGFICGVNEDRLSPVIYGGNGVNSISQEMPQDIVLMEEVGSQNTYAIAGLLASAKWLLEHDDAPVIESERSEQLIESLRSHPNIQIIAEEIACPRTGVVSCLFEGLSPDEAGSVLSDNGISVRAGLHCSPYAHKFLGTLPLGTVRFSVGPLTTVDDIRYLDEVLTFIEKNS